MVQLGLMRSKESEHTKFYISRVRKHSECVVAFIYIYYMSKHQGIARSNTRQAHIGVIQDIHQKEEDDAN